MNTIVIRPLVVDDWTAVQAIYSGGIGTGHATFEETPPSWTTFDAGKLTHSRLVAVDNTGTILGWVAASAVSSRSVYVGVVEHSVYVADTARGRGIGRALLKAFIASAEANGVWTIQSSVFPENTASLRLHQEFGFRELGRRERIALMAYGPLAGQWRDTLLLERRSTVN